MVAVVLKYYLPHAPTWNLIRSHINFWAFANFSQAIHTRIRIKFSLFTASQQLFRLKVGFRNGLVRSHLMSMIRSVCIICSSFTPSIFVGLDNLQIKMLACGCFLFLLCIFRIELCLLKIDCRRKQFCYACADDHRKNFWHLRNSTICLFVISRLDNFISPYDTQQQQHLKKNYWGKLLFFV